MPARLLIGAVLVLILALEHNHQPPAQTQTRAAKTHVTFAAMAANLQARMQKDETEAIRQQIHTLENLAQTLKQNAEGERQ